MAKLTLSDLVSIVSSETSAIGIINANNALTETALENTLSRDGTSPNTMGADLDMNSNNILNLPEPVTNTEPLRKGDIDTFVTIPKVFIQASEPSTSNPEDSLWIDSDSSANDVYTLISSVWVDSLLDIKGDTGAAGPSAFVSFRFDVATADVDPGSGDFRFDNTDVTLATQIFFSDNQFNGTDVSSWLATFDDSSSITKGQIMFVNPANSTQWVIFTVTGNVTDATTYFKIPVSHIASSSSAPFSDTTEIKVAFAPAGDAGTGAVTSFETRTGAVVSAAGDYTATEITNAPAGDIAAVTVQAAIDELDTEKLKTHAGVTDNRLVRTDGTTGNAVQDSGITVDDSDNVSNINTLELNSFQDLTEIVAPAAPAANVGRIYGVDKSGNTRPEWKTSTETIDLADHDNLANFVTNEHIDHTSVVLTAGSGLTGGGDIMASRNFAVGSGTGITVNADDVQLDTSSTRNTDHALVNITAGTGLTGGGAIDATRTLDVGAGTGITVNANDVAITTGGVNTTQLADNAADNTKIADMSSWTVKTRNAGTTGDPTDVKVSALTEEATPAAGDWILGEVSTGELRRYNVGNLPTGGGGEANTISNAGTGGVSVVATPSKVGIDLQLKSINAGSTKVTVTADDPNENVDIDVDGGLVLDGEVSGNGIVTRTAPETYTNRTITGTADQTSITNGDGVSGNPTIALANNLQMPGTEGFVPPDGTTAQRPGTPSTGEVRYNTTLDRLEYYDSAEWIDAIARTPQNNGRLCPHEDLVVLEATAATVDVDADALLLTDSNGLVRRETSVNLTANITASGANGLDTGTEAASTWYFIWVIAQPGGTVASLLSLSSTAPTMPAMYTYKGLVGAVRNDGSSNFLDFRQFGREVAIEQTEVLAGGAATSYTAVSLTGAVPSISTTITGIMLTGTSSGQTVTDIFITPSGSGTTSNFGETRLRDNFGNSSLIAGHFECQMDTGHQVFYRVAGTNAIGSIRVTGYRF